MFSLVYPIADGRKDYKYPEKTTLFRTRTGLRIYYFPKQWLYQFYEIASEPTTNASFLYTNRTLNTTWDCRDYNILSGADGRSTNITYDDAGRETAFDVREAAPNATTYISDTNQLCGERCARVWAFQTVKMNYSTETPSQMTAARLYDCNISVSKVDNAYLPEHELGDRQARIAAGAIARRGLPSNGTNSIQSNVYPEEYVCTYTIQLLFSFLFLIVTHGSHAKDVLFCSQASTHQTSANPPKRLVEKLLGLRLESLPQPDHKTGKSELTKKRQPRVWPSFCVTNISSLYCASWESFHYAV